MSAACTGLSALIQAATSQLGLLAETADLESDGSHLTSLEAGYASAGSSEIATTPPLGSSRAPMIVPEHEHSNGKLSFPEQLMTLLMDQKNEDVVTFLPDGKYFAIRRKEFSDTLLYKHFHLTTFEEFLELIRGWGFARVNSNNDNNDGEDNDDTDEASNSDVSSAKAAIHVFRHPFFKRNHPVDMSKLRFGSKKHAHQAVDTARVLSAVPVIAPSVDHGSTTHLPKSAEPGMVEKIVSDDHSTSSSKRRLSPSHLRRDTEDVIMKEQRPRHNSHDSTPMEVTSPTIVAAVSVSHDSGDHHPQPRRSSIELRGAAEAIATSKLKLTTCQMTEEDQNHHGSDPHTGSRRRKAERRGSTTSSLVEGGVEAATHTIVTDAIETLLFDEQHTRETFKKHEKELSISSLPGVVPISKQLFDGEPRSVAAATSIANTAINGSAAPSVSTSSPKQPTKATFNISNVLMNPNASSLDDLGRVTSVMTYDSLDEATRADNNDSHHVIAPRKVATDSKDSSTASRDAATALVSQSKQNRSHTGSSVRFAQNGN
jgi:HSF-type DNA-binding